MDSWDTQPVKTMEAPLQLLRVTNPLFRHIYLLSINQCGIFYFMLWLQHEEKLCYFAPKKTLKMIATWRSEVKYYITLNFDVLFWMFNIRFGHFLSHFGQISNKNFEYFLAETLRRTCHKISGLDCVCDAGY